MKYKYSKARIPKVLHNSVGRASFLSQQSDLSGFCKLHLVFGNIEYFVWHRFSSASRTLPDDFPHLRASPSLKQTIFCLFVIHGSVV
mmetsp:Transcript_16620/g.21807  ORF Transcript_16620/g.21807 Transcript_16620/m.21807 type:complete len:87 (+) Transcript_16620:1748-2008(+)